MRTIANVLRPAVLPLTELDKCPACYGISICDKIIKGQIQITPFGLYSAIAHLIGSKNVFFGTMGQRKVVIKKLAHSYELAAFDRVLCNNESLTSLCPRGRPSGRKYQDNVDYRSLISKTVTSSFLVPDASSLRLCPTAEHIDKLFQNVYNKRGYKDVYQWTMINVNPEPLVLQVNCQF